MIGNMEDAALAHAGHAPVLSSDGSTRIVYIINGVVYKVEIDYTGTNAHEYDVILSTRDSLPFSVFYPETSLYTINGEDVIAMEYIEGQAVAECWCDSFEEEHTVFCMPPDIADKVVPIMDDPSGMNVILNSTGAYIIDAA